MSPNYEKPLSQAQLDDMTQEHEAAEAHNAQRYEAEKITWDAAAKAFDTARWEGGDRAQARADFAQADKDLRSAHEAVLVSREARIKAYNVAMEHAA